MTKRQYHRHSAVSTLLEARALQVRRSDRRLAAKLGTLALGGAIALGSFLLKNETTANTPPSPAVKADEQMLDAGVVSAGQYGEHNAHALADRLRDHGFAVELLPVNDRLRVLIHAKEYTTARSAITHLALKEKVTDAQRGELKDGKYRAFTLAEQREEALDRYVCDDRPLPFSRTRAREDVTRYLLPIIKQESGFKPTVASHAGAVGLMQVMTNTARLIDTARNTTSRSRNIFPEYNCFREVAHGADLTQRTPEEYQRLLHNPWLNMDYGIATFLSEYKYCGENVECALARYNGGPQAHEPENRATETRQYVRSIMAMTKRK